ncbi:MAG TPA: hypothetical protein VFS43_25260 [Polyangiaceae bacterium]|nr:hypothetical protein [Polyangiaceae bacterium]
MMGPRTWVAALIDWILSAAVFAVAVRVLEAPSWRTVVALVALVLVGVGVDVRLVTLEPVRRA